MSITQDFENYCTTHRSTISNGMIDIFLEKGADFNLLNPDVFLVFISRLEDYQDKIIKSDNFKVNTPDVCTTKFKQCINLSNILGLKAMIKCPNTDVNQPIDGVNPLLYCVKQWSNQSVKTLLTSEKLYFYPCDKNGKTPVDIAPTYKASFFDMHEISDTLDAYEEKLNETKAQIKNLTIEELKSPDNKKMLIKYSTNAGLPRLFNGLKYKQQSALLDMFRQEIRANLATAEQISDIVYATYNDEKAQKKLKKQINNERNDRCR